MSSRKGQAAVLATLLVCLGILQANALETWTPNTFPNPQTDPARCGRRQVARSWICDPDGILTKKSADVIEGVLKDIASANEPYAHAKNCGGGHRLNEGYQASNSSERFTGSRPLWSMLTGKHHVFVTCFNSVSHIVVRGSASKVEDLCSFHQLLNDFRSL